MTFGVVLAGVAALLSAVLALVVASSSRGLRNNLLFSGGMLALASESVLGGFSLAATTSDDIQFWHSCSVLAGCLALGLWLWFSETYTRGPRSGSDDARRVRWALGFVPFVWAVVFARDLSLALPYSQTDPTWWIRYTQLGQILNVGRLIVGTWILVNLERTLRAAVGTARWRVKFVVLGIGAIYGVNLPLLSGPSLFRPCPGFRQPRERRTTVGWVVNRQRLFPTGFYPYGCVSVARGPAHFLHRFAGRWLSPGRRCARAIGRPIGRNRQLPVPGFSHSPRHPYPSYLFAVGKNSASSACIRLSQFPAAATRRPQGLDSVHRGNSWRQRFGTLCRRVTTLLSEAFNALTISLWVVDPQSDRLVLGASTQKLDGRPGSDKPTGPAVNDLRGLTRPFDLDSVQTPIATELRNLTAGQFQHGGHRIAVPLRAADHWLGVAILADRSTAYPTPSKNTTSWSASGIKSPGVS